MKKICRVLMVFMCLLALASCGPKVAEEAAEKGRGYFDSGDYETAAKAFGLAIENGNKDEEIKLLYDITLGYYQAGKEYEERDFETAKKILDGLSSEYNTYGIKENILTLQNNINKSIEAQTLLADVETRLAVADFSGATVSAEKIDANLLSSEEVEKLNGYKVTIANAKAAAEEAARRAEAERLAKKKAEEAKKQANKAQNTNKNNTTNAVDSINTNVSANEFIFPSDTVLLTKEQLNGLTKDQLALIRNEIYARKGHIFTTGKYTAYFSQKSWYKPEKSLRWADFTSTERKNIKLLQECEATR